MRVGHGLFHISTTRECLNWLVCGVYYNNMESRETPTLCLLN